MKQQCLTDFYSQQAYQETLRQLRSFFFARNFVEVDTQSRLSILAACEDPQTIATFTLSGVQWPLPQTGQMWLEHELLSNPEVSGFFCLTTSYRDEPNGDTDRHLKIFPLFEFETHGDMNTLRQLMADLFEYLGLGPQTSYCSRDYHEVASHYNVRELSSMHENQMRYDFGPVCFLNNFPLYTHPFFNMQRDGGCCKKIDAILYGIETVGAAERSTDVEQMRDMFYTISDGQYAATLYKKFGKERVERELEQFLSHTFITRSGGGIGVHRLIRALGLAQHEAGVAQSVFKGARNTVEVLL